MFLEVGRRHHSLALGVSVNVPQHRYYANVFTFNRDAVISRPRCANYFIDVIFNVRSGQYCILLIGVEVDVGLRLSYLCRFQVSFECNLFPMVSSPNLMRALFFQELTACSWNFGVHPRQLFLASFRFMPNYVKLYQVSPSVVKIWLH